MEYLIIVLSIIQSEIIISHLTILAVWHEKKGTSDLNQMQYNEKKIITILITIWLISLIFLLVTIKFYTFFILLCNVITLVTLVKTIKNIKKALKISWKITDTWAKIIKPLSLLFSIYTLIIIIIRLFKYLN